MTSCSGSNQAVAWPHPAQLVARMKMMGSIGVTMQDVVPGVAEQQPWSDYKGYFDPHTLSGQLELKKFPIAWIFGPTSSTLTGIGPGAAMPVAPRAGSASVMVPFGHQGTSSRTVDVNPGTGTGGTPPLPDAVGERVLFSDVGRSGRSDPIVTYEALIVNPVLWLDFLYGAQPIGQGISSRLGDRVVYRYDVIFNLAEAAKVTTGTQGNALRWLVSDLATRYIAGQVWVTASQDLVQIRLVRPMRTAPLPHSIANFPDSHLSQSITLTFYLGEHGIQITKAPRTSITMGISSPGTASRCVPAGDTGLTTAVVARRGELVTGTVNASGCDIGVFIGSDAPGASIEHATITGARVHAVMVVGTAGTVIKASTLGTAPDLSLNGMLRAMLIPQNKAVVLAGTSDALVAGNSISGTLAGGVSIVDDGTVDAGAINPGTPRKSVNNVVIGNTLTTKGHQCGIVVAAYNPREGVIDNTVSGNDAVGVSIVVAADAPGASAISNVVKGNIITESKIPGVIIHSNAPHDAVLGTVVSGNHISYNGADNICQVNNNTGVAVIADYQRIFHTSITGNVITHEEIGIWVSGSRYINLSGNDIVHEAGGASIVNIVRIVHCREIF